MKLFLFVLFIFNGIILKEGYIDSLCRIDLGASFLSAFEK